MQDNIYDLQRNVSITTIAFKTMYTLFYQLYVSYENE